MSANICEDLIARSHVHSCDHPQSSRALPWAAAGTPFLNAVHAPEQFLFASSFVHVKVLQQGISPSSVAP